MCGIFAIYSKHYNKNIINNVINGLKLLQHRGKDGSGISYITGTNNLKLIKALGRVSDSFKDYSNNDITKMCIGHVRYSTSGKTITKGQISENEKKNELQPFIGKTKKNELISIIHNGNIPNIKNHDTQFLLDILLTSEIGIESTLIHIMNIIPAAYSLILLVNDRLYIMRDRYGIRPLSIANKGESIYISSETRALVGCTNIQDVKSGDIMRLDKNGATTIYSHPKAINGLCAFELIYFMNPRSYYNGIEIQQFRKVLGKILAQKEKINFTPDTYTVVGIPSSGLIAAKGYAEHLSLPYKQLIKKVTNYTNGEDRTFILLKNDDRIKACRKKFKYDIDNIKGRKIIIIDDTIVRGNVIKSIIDSLKACGAAEIHVRIPSPPVVDICQLGIAIQSKNELIMHNRSIDEVRKLLEVNSLNYLCLDELTMFPKDAYKECFGGGIASEIVNNNINKANQMNLK